MTYRDGYEIAEGINAELRDEVAFLRGYLIGCLTVQYRDEGHANDAARALARGHVEEALARFRAAEAKGKGVAVAPLA